MSQKTIAQLNAEIDAQITSNGANAITAAVMRPVLKDMADSAANVADGQTLYSGNGTMSSDRTVAGNSKQLTFSELDAFILDATSGGGAVGIYVEANQNGTLSLSSFDADGNAAIDFEGEKIMVESPFVVVTIGNTGICNFVGNGGGAFKIGSSISDKIAFLGSTPTAQTANANQAVATDPTSTQTLANALRQELIDRGLWKGSA